jgi:hypothetical protein
MMERLLGVKSGTVIQFSAKGIDRVLRHSLTLQKLVAPMNLVQRFVFLTLLVLASLPSYAQTSSLVIFNEHKEDFTLTINGAVINPKPAQHIRITDLKPSSYKVEAAFANPSLPKQLLIVQIFPGRETSYALTRNGKLAGPLTFQFLSEFSTGYFPIAPQASLTFPYQGPLVDPGATVQQPSVKPTVTDPQPVMIDPIRPNPLPGYNGPVGCPYPMDAAAFGEAKKSIASKSFSDTKMQLAKQIMRSNCLITAQVLELMELLSFESEKLELAKYAYDYTYDRGNYYKINDAFGFESSVRDLEKYLQQKASNGGK